MSVRARKQSPEQNMKRPNLRTVNCCKNCEFHLESNDGEVFCNVGRDKPEITVFHEDDSREALLIRIDRHSRWRLNNGTHPNQVCDRWKPEAKS